MKYIYIASCEKDGGIYRYALGDGKLRFVDKTPCDRPMYMAREGDTLYVLLRAPFAHSDESGVISYRVRTDGSLTDPTPPVSTKGTVGCHIAVRDGDVYVANYTSGSVCHVGHVCDNHEGKSAHPKRQTSPHAHSVLLSPSGKYLLSADLGTDRIYVYDRALATVAVACATAASGPRHMVFSHNGQYLYVVNELSSDVTVYLWHEDGSDPLMRLESFAALRDPSISSIASAIRLSADGGRLYVTNRGENTVAVFSVQGEKLSRLASYPTYGDEPRDFLLLDDEKYAVVTNQFAHSIVLYRHTDGVLECAESLPLPSPLAVLEF